MTGDEKRIVPATFVLNSNDNPGTLITHVVLKGNNYEEWAKVVRVSLRAKKKLGFINGSIVEPAATEEEDVEDWWTVNSMVVPWIFNTIEPSLRSTISYRDLAKQLWDDIKQRFSVGNGTKIYQLKMEVVKCNQQTDETIMSYYGRIKKIWDNLSDFDILPTCACNGCKCGITEILNKRREDERVREFLMGLDSSYATARSNLLGTEPLPSNYLVYSKLTQEEEVRNSTPKKIVDKPEALSFAVRGSSEKPRQSGGIKRSDGLVCTHCKRPGHEATSCFSLVGYPEWWGDWPRERGGAGQGKGRNADHGRAGQDKGRPAELGRAAEKNDAARVHMTRAGGGIPSSSSHLGEGDREALHGLSNEEWYDLINLWNAQKAGNIDRLNGKALDDFWIVDTGATHHMTGRRDWFASLNEINSIPVGLPNGEVSNVVQTGSVVLGSNLTLTKVLYVPSLNCNLISVSQLLQNSNIRIQFTNRIFVIQDRIMRTTIGAGEQYEGLYYLPAMTPARVNIVNGLGDLELWHQRLGHPSWKVVNGLPQVRRLHKIDNLDNKPCDVCFRAKQTRETFHVSENKSADIFDLIHCDLWGPYPETASCGSRYFLTIVDDFSRGVWVYLLKEKSDVPRLIKNFLALVKRQYKGEVKILRSDNGTEFTCLKNYFAEQGIIHKKSMVKTPQQNARVERKHRHILNVARALRFQANLSIKFWGQCILTAAYLINRTPSSVLNEKTPYERLHGEAPSMDNIKVFGCLSYAKNLHASDKFASRSRRCILVGYLIDKKGWSLYEIETGDYFDSRDVVFYESMFPYHTLSEESNQEQSSTASIVPLIGRNEEYAADDAPNALRLIKELVKPRKSRQTPLSVLEALPLKI